MGKEKSSMTLEKMCMLDRFLFSEAMEDPWIHRFLLETIFQRNICLKQIPVTEKILQLIRECQK